MLIIILVSCVFIFRSIFSDAATSFSPEPKSLQMCRNLVLHRRQITDGSIFCHQCQDHIFLKRFLRISRKLNFAQLFYIKNGRTNTPNSFINHLPKIKIQVHFKPSPTQTNNLRRFFCFLID